MSTLGCLLEGNNNLYSNALLENEMNALTLFTSPSM